jgi:hypothetical protein
MKILAHRNVNLHTASTADGLVHIPAGTSKDVSDDVAKHPGFALLKKAGFIVQVADEPAEPEKPKAPEKPKEPAKAPEQK